MTHFTHSDIPAQTGKTAIVTGANTGIGLEIARELARKGARVLLACRDGERAAAAIEDIAAGPDRVDVDYLHLDLANMASIRDAAEKAKHEKRIDLLIDNAGVMMPPLGHATGGAELQFAVNHLGHFALVGLLLDKLAADGGARVVTQSSLAARRGRIDFGNLDAGQGYDRNVFYSQSKLANLMFALELDRRLRMAESEVFSLACHPGIAATELGRHMGPVMKPLFALAGKALNSARNGALPALQAATDPAAQGGDYFGPYGLAEARGNSSGRAIVPRQACDKDVATGLWDRSVELTGVDPGLPPAT